MSTTAPVTPENTPRRIATAPGLNRSFTLPTKIATTSRTNPTAEIGATEGVETLYVHPNSKIVKFASASSTARGGPASGTLPWVTPTEQTLAAGPLEIYRVPGSVSFLHSGSLLHAILPRSNCWCVDGVSKFAMRVLADTYYRIELPGDSPEDLQKVEEFKETLNKVLFYERTACPFARRFTVDLPDEEPQPKKKRRKSHGPAKKWKLDRASKWKPEDGERPPENEESSSGSLDASDEDEEGSSSNDDGSQTSELADQVKEMRIPQTPTRPSVRQRAMGINMRSATAPPGLLLHSTSTLRSQTASIANDSTETRLDERSTSLNQGTDTDADARDPNPRLGALRPFQSIPTDMPPSPPDSSAGFDFTEQTTIPSAMLPAQASIPSPGPPMNAATQTHVTSAPGESPFPSADQWDAKPDEVTQQVIVGTTSDSETDRSVLVNSDMSTGKNAKFVSGVADTEDTPQTVTALEQNLGERVEDQGQTAHDNAAAPEPEPADPFAQIQARIQARRSIGGTTSFHPTCKSPTRQSSASTAASLSSTRSGVSRLSQQHHQQQQAFATALVNKACAVFLGPPAHLVAIMLRIAARFAKGAAFPGSSFLFDSPAAARTSSKRVPGSFDLAGNDVDELGLDDERDWEEEDDFGVPIRSPVRLATSARDSAGLRRLSDETALRARRTWDDSGGGVGAGVD